MTSKLIKRFFSCLSMTLSPTHFSQILGPTAGCCCQLILMEKKKKGEIRKENNKGLKEKKNIYCE
jgi:hypothetical protein